MLFVCGLVIFTEFNTGLAGQTSVILYKRGSRAVHKRSSATAVDEEKAGTKDSSTVTHEKQDSKADTNSETADLETLKMRNVFTWQRVKYVVPVDHHEHRQLLDDVSGYVAPGVLTALMGESGAGKVSDCGLLLTFD